METSKCAMSLQSPTLLSAALESRHTYLHTVSKKPLVFLQHTQRTLPLPVLPERLSWLFATCRATLLSTTSIAVPPLHNVRGLGEWVAVHTNLRMPAAKGSTINEKSNNKALQAQVNAVCRLQFIHYVSALMLYRQIHSLKVKDLTQGKRRKRLLKNTGQIYMVAPQSRDAR